MSKNRDFIEEGSQLEASTIGVFRSAATIKGGRRFSFGSLVVVGDRNGQVGIGYGKANEVPPAIEKAQKDARKNISRVKLHAGTIPHEVTGRYAASVVRIFPASPGTGVVAGATVRAVLEMVGITDCLTKSYGSNNKKNLAKATLEGLKLLQTKEEIAELRGVTIDKTDVDEMIERGQAFMPSSSGGETAMKAPVNTVAPERGRGGRGGGRGGRGGRGGGGGGGRGYGGGQPQQQQQTAPESASEKPSEGSSESESKD
ncbi:MAG: 30S ribosomal protein S5 [Phycisphaerales bacterium]